MFLLDAGIRHVLVPVCESNVSEYSRSGRISSLDTKNMNRAAHYRVLEAAVVRQAVIRVFGLPSVGGYEVAGMARSAQRHAAFGPGMR